MYKDRKYLFGVFHGFDEPSIVMSSEILTEDKEGFLVHLFFEIRAKVIIYLVNPEHKK